MASEFRATDNDEGPPMLEATVGFTDMTPEQFQAHLDERSVNTHDAAAVARFFTEDGVQRRIGRDEPARGREAIRAAMEETFRVFPDFRVEVRDLFSSDDRLCVECRLTGTQAGEWQGLPPTGRHIDLQACLVFRIGPDGLVEEEDVYADFATMLRQLGVLPEA